jgi:cobalt-zinc-cadmium efflux system protein
MGQGHDHHSHGHHSHGHHHAAAPKAASGGAFVFGAALNLSFIAVEIGYGITGNSVALLSDAGHNFGDVLGLLVALAGNFLARRAPTLRFTYGWRGSSILAALFNSVVLLIFAGGIAVEAARRLANPSPVAGNTVMIVAALGIAINGATALLFHKSSHRDINARAAFLHMAGDAVISLGVVLSGAAVALSGIPSIDPAVSLIIAVFLVVSTWRLLRQSFSMSLQAVPFDIEPGAVKNFLAESAGVSAVHDLHIWAMSTAETALTCHLVMPGGHPGDAALARIAHDLHDRFGIGHSTIQVETGDPAFPCELVPDHVV